MMMTKEGYRYVYEDETEEVGEHDVLYVRVRVVNTKPRIAKGCRAYLVRIDEKTRYEWITVFKDSMPLIWSYEAESATLDLPKGVVKHIDLVRIQSGQDCFTPQMRSETGTVLLINEMEPVFERQSLFRFVVRVAAEDVSPAEITATVNQNGDWPPKCARVDDVRPADEPVNFGLPAE